MSKGATTCLSILALLVAICLGTGTSTIPSVTAGEFILKTGEPLGSNGSSPAPLGGGGIPGPGGGGGAVDSGDDDDYWDGVNNDQQPPRAHAVVPLLLQILETWWQNGHWVMP